MNNIIKTPAGTMILNGGNPLGDCPESFEKADAWAEEQNKDKDKYVEPTWSFDCGFKLDFDGPILSISSRFYPPKTSYGPKWNGTVAVLLMGKQMSESKFECDNLEQLKDEVKKFVVNLESSISF